MTFAPLLLSLAAVAFFALSEQRGRAALGACAAALAAWAFCAAHGPVRGPVVALVFVMGEASALVLLAGARPRWIAPVAKSSFVLGALSLLVQWT
jgi:hypothetical protein